jgi:hypothetical protein
MTSRSTAWMRSESLLACRKCPDDSNAIVSSWTNSGMSSSCVRAGTPSVPRIKKRRYLRGFKHRELMGTQRVLDSEWGGDMITETGFSCRSPERRSLEL